MQFQWLKSALHNLTSQQPSIVSSNESRYQQRELIYMQTSPKRHLLHVALYARGGIRDANGNLTYHWAFNVSEANQILENINNGTKYHVLNTMMAETGTNPWRFEKKPLSLNRAGLLLVRITIAEVLNYDRLVQILESMPVRQGDASFNCRTWLRDATKALDEGGCLGERVMDWEAIEAQARKYVGEKMATGRWKREGEWDIRITATWSMLEGREIIP